VIEMKGLKQGVTTTNSALVYEPKCGGRRGVAGSQPMSIAARRSLNELWRSNSIFNPCFKGLVIDDILAAISGKIGRSF
jgi:hypothetical protein